MKTTGTMAEDIDIEEHDLLDNPSVKTLFPDLSVIKKEIEKFAELGPNITLNEKNAAYIHHTLPDNVKVEDVKLDDDYDKDFQVIDESERSEIHTHTSDEGNGNFSNKIILGSKPNQPVDYEEFFKQHVDRERAYNVSVALGDMGPYLQMSNRFCKLCQTLFPSKKSLDGHGHIFNLNKQKNDETLHFHIQSQRFVHRLIADLKKASKSCSADVNKRRCFHCNEFFITKKDLIEHLYDILNKSNKNNGVGYGSKEVNKNIPDVKKCVVLLKKVQQRDGKVNNKNFESKERSTTVKRKFKGARTKPTVHQRSNTYNISLKSIAQTGKTKGSRNPTMQKSTLKPDIRFKKHYKKNLEIHLAKELEVTVSRFESSKKDLKPNEENSNPSNEEGLILSGEDFEPIEGEDCRSSGNNDELNLKELKINQESNISDRKTITLPADLGFVYQCPICPLVYNHPKKLYTHAIKNHGMLLPAKDFVKSVLNSVCKYCFRRYKSVSRFVNHTFHHHKDLLYKRVQPFHETKKNNTEKTSIKVYQCGACSYYFTTKTSCLEHLKNKHHVYYNLFDETYFDPACKYCSVKCQTRFLYNEHLDLSHKQYINEKHGWRDYQSNLNFNKAEKINTDSVEVLYQCHICSFYLPTEEEYQLHLSIKHCISETNQVFKKTFYDPVCKYCQVSFLSPTQYNLHLIDRHGYYVYDKGELNSKHLAVEMPDSTKPENDPMLISDDNANIEKDLRKSKFYKCYICSCYFTFKSRIWQHLHQNHGDKNEIATGSLKTASFDPRCPVCNLKFSSLAKYNKHIRYFHKDLNTRKIGHFEADSEASKLLLTNKINKIKIVERMKERKKNILFSEHPIQYPLILKTAIFQCLKCDIHFLSPESAKNHSYHPEMLINWKCPSCHLIFKVSDKTSHEIQHIYSQKFKVHGIHPNNSINVLYACMKCNVHFDRDIFLNHVTTCENEMPNCLYCKSCHIQIDSNISKAHEISHEKLKASDFIIVESDILPINESNRIDQNNADKFSQNRIVARKRTNLKSKFSGKKPRKEPNELKLYLYCNTCKSYVQSLENKLHKLQMCFDLEKDYCRICGLTFTSKAAALNHKHAHNVMKDFNLNNLTFYDFNEKIIAPPVPEYRKCKTCLVNFVKKQLFLFHKCGKADYKKCSICGNKYDAEAFDLHMNFHNYSQKQVTIGIRESKIDNIVLEYQALLDVHSIESILYKCKHCRIAFDTYDKMVEHCQMHLTYEEHDIKCSRCTICNIELDTSCFEKHQSLHATHENVDFFTVLQFDTFYFTSPNMVWNEHVLGKLRVEVRHKILQESIYRYECRVKMEVSQNGASDLTVYKCDQCDTIINNLQLFKHAETSCFKIRKHECSVCGMPFHSCDGRLEHEKIHSVYDLNSECFRIVSFNKEQDKRFNRLLFYRSQYFVLYQCRNCAVATDRSNIKDHKCYDMQHLKKCYECNLWVSVEDCDTHISRHQSISSFTQTNLKLIMFGESSERSDEKMNVLNSFLGTVKDYTLYRCPKCQLCVSIKDRLHHHKCSIAARVRCTICECYLNDSTSLKKHLKQHEIDLDFIKKNIRIVDVDLNVKSNNLEIFDEGNAKYDVTNSKYVSIKESEDSIPVMEDKQTNYSLVIETPELIADPQSETEATLTPSEGLVDVETDYSQVIETPEVLSDSQSETEASLTPREVLVYVETECTQVIETPEVLADSQRETEASLTPKEGLVDVETDYSQFIETPEVIADSQSETEASLTPREGLVDVETDYTPVIETPEVLADSQRETVASLTPRERLVDVETDYSQVIEISEVLADSQSETEASLIPREGLVDVETDYSQVIETPELIADSQSETEASLTPREGLVDVETDYTQVIETPEVIADSQSETETSLTPREGLVDVETDYTQVIETPEVLADSQSETVASLTPREGLVDVETDYSQVIEISEVLADSQSETEASLTPREGLVDVETDYSQVIETPELIADSQSETEASLTTRGGFVDVETDYSHVIETPEVLAESQSETQAS